MSELPPLADIGEITGSLPDDAWNDLYEKLVLEATKGGNAPGFTEARAQYFSRTGEVYADDQDYNERMSLFLDWFVFGWKDAEGRTPGEKILADPESGLDALKDLEHALYEFLGSKGTYFRAKNLISGEKMEVLSGPLTPFLSKDDPFEARILSSYDGRHLVGPMCIHPGPAKKLIVKRIKAIRKELKKTPEEIPARAEELLLQLRELRIKARRYSHVDPAKIYGEGLGIQ